MTFTKEWLQHQIAEFEYCAERTDGYRLDEGGNNTLAALKMALAGMEAVPVAWLLSGGGAKNDVRFDSSNAYADPLRDVTPLYAAPQLPQLAVVPPEATAHEARMAVGFNRYTQAGYIDGWNACRATVLQGAEPKRHDAIDKNLIEALRLVQCMLDDYRERNYGNAEGWIRHINTHMSDYSEAHGDDAYSVLHDLLPAAPQHEVK